MKKRYALYMMNLMLGLSFSLSKAVYAESLAELAIDDTMRQAQRALFVGDLKAARGYFKKTSHNEKTKSESELALIEIDFREGSPKGALKDINNYLEEFPLDLDARALKISFLRRTGDVDGAEKFLQKSLTLDGEHPKLIREVALMKIEKSEYLDAIKLLKFVVEKNDEDDFSLSRLAYAQEKAGQLSDAMVTYDKLRVRYSTNHKIRIAIAKTLLKLGKFDEALEAIKIAAHISSENPEIAVIMGDINAKLGRTEDAVNSYFAAIDRGLNNPEAYNDISDSLVAIGQTRKAVLALEIAHNRFEDNSSVVQNLASLYDRTKKTAQYVALLTKHIEVKPNDIWAQVQLGQLYYKADEFKHVVKVIKKPFEEGYHNVDSCNLLAASYSRTGQKKDAYKVLVTAQKSFPNEPKILFNLANVAEELDQVDVAEASYKAVPASSKDLFFKAGVNLSLLYEKQGKFGEARNALVKVRESAPEFSNKVNDKIVNLDKKVQGNGVSTESNDRLPASVISPQ